MSKQFTTKIAVGVLIMLDNLPLCDLPFDSIEIGRVAGAFGLRGGLKVQSYSEHGSVLATTKHWFLLPKLTKLLEKIAPDGTRKIVSNNPCRKLLLTKVSSSIRGFMAQSEFIIDRNQAEALIGARIFISRSTFPKTKEDEFYWADLLQLSVINREQVVLGTVSDLLTAGPQTVLVLNYLLDNKSCERLIPFVSAYVDAVDLVNKTIIVDWQADY
jgi:16S rRNA processing protein RimM